MKGTSHRLSVAPIGLETRTLKHGLNRKEKRFPEIFMFPFSKEELEITIRDLKLEQHSIPSLCYYRRGVVRVGCSAVILNYPANPKNLKRNKVFSPKSLLNSIRELLKPEEPKYKRPIGFKTERDVKKLIESRDTVIETYSEGLDYGG